MFRRYQLRRSCSGEGSFVILLYQQPRSRTTISRSGISIRLTLALGYRVPILTNSTAKSYKNIVLIESSLVQRFDNQDFAPQVRPIRP
jgi:hypothetical protein